MSSGVAGALPSLIAALPLRTEKAIMTRVGIIRRRRKHRPAPTPALELEPAPALELVGFDLSDADIVAGFDALIASPAPASPTLASPTPPKKKKYKKKKKVAPAVAVAPVAPTAPSTPTTPTKHHPNPRLGPARALPPRAITFGARSATIGEAMGADTMPRSASFDAINHMLAHRA